MSDGWTPRWKRYDRFESPQLDTGHWTLREAAATDGTKWRYMDPGVTMETGSGELVARAPRFHRGHDAVQSFDNAKLLILSEPAVTVPAEGALSVAVEINAEKHGGAEADLRDGFAALNVVDLDTGMVFDLATTGARQGAIYERLPLGSWDTFLHLVDSPLHSPPIGEDGWQEFCIEINAAEGSARWLIDGVCVFSVAKLPAVPRTVRFGPGLLTLLRIGEHGSVSAHGQGVTARWRNFRTASRG